MTTLRTRAELRARAMQRAAEQHTGVMVAFPLAPELVAALARPGGEAPDELHMTLAFLGDEADREDWQRLRDAVGAFAAQEIALSGQVSGCGRFSAPEGQPDPYYASADLPALPEFRQRLVAALDAAGFPPSRTHGFTPHITLAYLDQAEPTPQDRLEPLPLVCDSLLVSIGTERTVYPLQQRIERAGDPADALIAQLQDAAGSDRSAIAALVERYRAGTLSLPELATRAHDVLAERYEEEAGDVDASTRGHGLLFRASVALGAIAGLSLLGGGSPRAAAGTAASLSLSVGAAEFGGSVTHAETTAAARGLNDRLGAIREKQASGEISTAQAAAQTATAVSNFSWHRYQTRRNEEAVSRGAAADWALDESAQHCDGCLELAENSPYPADQLPTIPGAGDTPCGPGCKCDVHYRFPAEDDAGDEPEQGDDSEGDDE